MLAFLRIFLCFFAACGLFYLLRDAWRALFCYRLGRARMAVVISRAAYEDEALFSRALSELAALLSRAGARRLIGQIVIIDAAAEQIEPIYRAADALSIEVDTQTREALTSLVL